MKIFEQVVRYIAGTLILIVAIVEVLRIIGIKPDMGYDILKAVILIGVGLFVGFYDPNLPKKPE